MCQILFSIICVLGHAAACGFCGSYRLCDDFVSLFLAFEAKVFAVPSGFASIQCCDVVSDIGLRAAARCLQQ